MSGRLVVFDMDGTLVDSRAAIVGCFQHALAARGIEPVPDQAIARNIGLPLGQMLDGIVPEDQIEGCIAVYRKAFPDWDRRLTRPFPGVFGLLRRLRSRGDRMVVASSKSLVGVQRVVHEQGIADLFDGLFGGDSVQQGKPHPEMLRLAMHSVGLGPEHTVMVGDTTFDIEMGVAAGVRSLGVGWGMHPAQRLIQAGAERVAKDSAELGKALSV